MHAQCSKIWTKLSKFITYTFHDDGLTGFSAYNSQNNGQCSESSQEHKKHDQNETDVLIVFNFIYWYWKGHNKALNKRPTS